MYSYKTFIGIATTGLLTLTASAASAAIIDFELDFFDYDVLIGEGSFSYDDEEQLTCFDINSEMDVKCYSESGLTEEFGDLSLQEISDSLTASYDIFTNIVTDFSAEIYGVSWNKIYPMWWADEESGQLPGKVSASGRDGAGILEGSWLFGFGSALGVEIFDMNFEQASKTFGKGNWFQDINNPPDVPISFTSGTFEARRVGTMPSEPSDSTSVPEPSNVFGFLIALILGDRAKRRLG